MCIELPLLQEYVWFRKILVLSGMGVSESHSGGRACNRIVEVFLTPRCFCFFNSQQRCFKCICLHRKKIFSYYMVPGKGQIYVPYFIWRCPERIPHCLFPCYSLLYSSKTKMIPVINLIGMVHWFFWTLHLFQQTSLIAFCSFQLFVVENKNNK